MTRPRVQAPAAVFAALLVLAVSSLAAHAAARPGLHWGAPQPMGAGSARAWVAVDMDGSPTSMGVSIDEKAMASTRDHRDRDTVLPLPVTAGVRAPGFGPDSKLAFRVRWDAATHSHIVVLEGLQAMPPLNAAR